jgi:transcriptional regulator with XRE-family HTH domain
MTPAEIKAEIEERELDRREIARKMGYSYGYLNAVLNGFAPLLPKVHDCLVEALAQCKTKKAKKG